MSEEPADGSEPANLLELVSDGENLLVVGDDRRAAERFLKYVGVVGEYRRVSLRMLGPALHSSAEVARTVAGAVRDSGLWVKLTPEAAAAIKEFGLTDTDVPGVAYAMAGTRGSLKKWLQIDVTAKAKVASPSVLAGLAGALEQAARHQEASQLRELLGTLDQKLDQVLRGQRDEILGDLAGIEREIRAALHAQAAEGVVDPLTWSKLAPTSVELRQVQSKAILKLEGVADDLERHRRVGSLNTHLPQAKAEVQLWLSTIARCTAALDELAVLEIDHCAVVAPGRVNAKRMSLAALRRDDLAELDTGISALVQRMDSAAELANQNKILHVKGVPEAIRSIEATRSLVKHFYEALDVEIDLEALDPTEWRAAIREWRQWRNGLAEGGAVAWEKGWPALGTLILPLLVAAARDRVNVPKPSSR